MSNDLIKINLIEYNQGVTMLLGVKNFAVLSLFIFTQAIAEEEVTVKGLSKDSLGSFYEGVAKTLENHGKRNYEKVNSLGYEEKSLLNFKNIMSPINSLSTIKDFEMFRKGALLTSISLASEDKLGSFKDICLKVGTDLSGDDIEKAVNQVIEGEFKIEYLDFLILGAREKIGEKFTC
jgi:hypothetical protein